MIGALALASLRRHTARTSLGILGVAVAAALLLDMVMLATGMRESFRRFLLIQGFDLRIAPKGTLPMDTEATIGDASHLLAALRANPQIATATPVLGGQLHLIGTSHAVTTFGVGVDPATQADYQLERGAPVAGSRPHRGQHGISLPDPRASG